MTDAEWSRVKVDTFGYITRTDGTNNISSMTFRYEALGDATFLERIEPKSSVGDSSHYVIDCGS